MSWLFLSIISVSAISVSNILQRVLLQDKDSDVYAYGFTFQLICAVILIFFALINGFTVPALGSIWLNIIFSSALYGGFTVVLFKALQFTEASQVVVLLTSAVLWTILVAATFLGESFGLLRILGTVLIIVAVLIISSQKTKISLHRGTVYLLLAGLFSGIAFANDTYVLRQLDAFSYSAISFTLVTLMLPIYKISLVKKLNSFLEPKLLLRMLLMSIFYSIFVLTSYSAYRAGGNASQIGPILQVRVILTILLATIFLKEKNNLLKKFISAVLVTAGVFLVK